MLYTRKRRSCGRRSRSTSTMLGRRPQPVAMNGARALTNRGSSCDLGARVGCVWASELPEWRNGRLGGLKSPFPRGSVGSSPTSGTADLVARSAKVEPVTFCCVQCRLLQGPSGTCEECAAPMTAPVELVRELLFYR